MDLRRRSGPISRGQHKTTAGNKHRRPRIKLEDVVIPRAAVSAGSVQRGRRRMTLIATSRVMETQATGFLTEIWPLANLDQKIWAAKNPRRRSHGKPKANPFLPKRSDLRCLKFNHLNRLCAVCSPCRVSHLTAGFRQLSSPPDRLRSSISQAESTFLGRVHRKGGAHFRYRAVRPRALLDGVGRVRYVAT
jgi:hypothetical protein